MVNSQMLVWKKEAAWFFIMVVAVIFFIFTATPLLAKDAGIATTFLESNTGFGANHAISGDGRRVVFESSSDITGGNSDANGELFLWDQDTGIRQLTSTTGSTFYWSFDINHDGSAIAVAAEADITGSGATLIELYRWREFLGWAQLTVSSGALDLVYIGGVAISDDGTRIMFTSKDNYTGQNSSAELQVYLWKAGILNGTKTQITHGTPCGLYGANFGSDISGDGSKILFSSRCQFGSSNTDLNTDIFLWSESTGITALTNEPDDVGARGSLNQNGSFAAMASGTDLVNGGNAGAHHLYRWKQGRGFERISVEGVHSQGKPSISADGSRIIFTANNGQNTSSNPENAPELFVWQKGLGIFMLTDSAQTDTSYGNQDPEVADDGRRLSMIALRAFAAPTDNRTGYFVIDILSLPSTSPSIPLLLLY